MANSQDKKTEEALPPVRISIIPFVVLIGLMAANLILDTIEVPSEMVLFLSTIFASLVAFFILKIPYNKIETGMLKSIDMAMHANLIQLQVGPPISIWIESVLVPMSFHYVLGVISP